MLVEANSLFLSDMLGIGMQLQRAYRQGYGFDARNSAITAVRGKPEMVALEVHGALRDRLDRDAAASAPPGAPMPTCRSFAARSRAACS